MPVCCEEESQSFVEGMGESRQKEHKNTRAVLVDKELMWVTVGWVLYSCYVFTLSPHHHALCFLSLSVALWHQPQGAFLGHPPNLLSHGWGNHVNLGFISTPPLLVRVALSVLCSNLGSFISQSCDLEHIV